MPGLWVWEGGLTKCTMLMVLFVTIVNKDDLIFYTERTDDGRVVIHIVSVCNCQIEEVDSAKSRAYRKGKSAGRYAVEKENERVVDESGGFAYADCYK